MGTQATATHAALVRRMRADAVRVRELHRMLLSTHPERMTAQDWRDLRIDALKYIELLADQIDLSADLQEQLEVYRGRRNS